MILKHLDIKPGPDVPEEEGRQHPWGSRPRQMEILCKMMSSV